MAVYPIAITKVDWGVFNVALNEAIGQRATYRTDSKNLKAGSVVAFFHSLDTENGDLLTPALKHGMFTILITELSKGMILKLVEGWDCTFKHGSRDDEHYMILSASISNWLDFLKLMCDGKQPIKIRQIGNDVYNMLDRMGFKSTFMFTRYSLTDGTFELCKGK